MLGGIRIRTTKYVIVFLCVFSVEFAQASPQARFDEDFARCTEIAQRAPDNFSCTICGVVSSCSGENCNWGVFQFGRASDNVSRAMEQGYPVYCTGGGARMSVGSPAGMQSSTMNRVLNRAESQNMKVGSTQGAFFETSNTDYKNTDGVEKELGANALAIPIGYHFSFGAFHSLDLGGQLIASMGNGLNQIGLTANPTYTFPVYGADNDHSLKVVLGMSVPMQLFYYLSDELEAGSSWSIGGTLLGGVTQPFGRLSIGGGFAIDGRYIEEALSLPSQFILRATYAPPILDQYMKLALQPGLAFDLANTGAFADTRQESAMFGADIAGWIFGYQVFHSEGNLSHGFGISYVGEAGQMAANQETVPVEAPFELEDTNTSTATQTSTSTVTL